MKQKSFIIIMILAITIYFLGSCHSNEQKTNEKVQPVVTRIDTVVIYQGMNTKGVGRFKEVKLTHPIDQKMANKGEMIFGAKCIACHKLTDEKLVGPGWKGVTDRRKPEWIMNFTTNTKVMLDKDLAAQSMLVTCLVRMPNQDLTDDQARDILEFMRKNDGSN